MVTVGFKVSTAMLAQIDAAAEAQCQTRSAYLSSLVASQNQIADLTQSVLDLAKLTRALTNMVADLYLDHYPQDGGQRIEAIKKEADLS